VAVGVTGVWEGVKVSVGVMGVTDGVNVYVGVMGVIEGVDVSVDGRKGVKEGSGVSEGVDVNDAVGVRVNVTVAVSRFGVVDGPVVVGMMRVSVREPVIVGVGVGVFGPGAN